MTQFILNNIKYVSMHTSLHLQRVRDNIRYKYTYTPLIYCIVCNVTNKLYVGSTWDSVRRFRQHLVTGHTSNEGLQADIKEHGLENFTLFVLTIVQFPEGLTKDERRTHLHKIEQEHKDLFLKDSQYPNRRSYVRRSK